MRPVSVLRIGAEAARTASLLGDVVSPLLNRDAVTATATAT
jgi:hypothetical protein